MKNANSKSAVDLFNRGQIILTLLLIFVTPFFFLPITLDWFEQAKILFVTIVCTIIGIKLIAGSFLGNKMDLVSTAIDKYLILIPLVLIASSILSTNQLNLRIASILTDPIQFIALTAVFYVIVNSLKKESDWFVAIKLLSWPIVLLGGLNGLQILLVQIAEKLPFTQSLISQNPLLVNFNPSGSPFVLALMLVIILPILIALHNQTENKKKAGSTILIAITIFSLVAIGWFLFRNRPILLDHDTARKIASGVLGRSYGNAIFGMGPGQFNSAFNLYRLGDFNQSSFWDRNFVTSSNFFFYALSIGGILTMGILFGLITKLYSIARERFRFNSFGTMEKSILISLALGLAITLIFPTSFMVLWLIYVILALLFSQYLINNIPLTKVMNFSKTVQIQIVGFVVLILLASSYGQSVTFVADTFYRQSLDAASKNRGAETYNLQLRAMQTAPWKDLYRMSISQTNLALADSLSSRQNLSDQERQTVVQLVQQSLAEARNAVALNPNSSANWQNLALIYRSLINFAQGSDEWAKSTENQAIVLSPFDPRLRLDLGGLYFSQGDYQNAANNFGAAIQLKPDYANAHYNLAQAFKQLKINDQAVQQLQLTSQIVCTLPTGKVDCDKVNNEIAELTKGQANPTTDQNNSQSQLATPAGQNKNLPKAKTQPPVKIASPGGELAQ